MKVKLDENFGERGARILREGGCDVATVVAQDLCSASDDTLIEVCRAEGRALISLDKDFTNTLRCSVPEPPVTSTAHLRAANIAPTGMLLNPDDCAQQAR